MIVHVHQMWAAKGMPVYEQNCTLLSKIWIKGLAKCEQKSGLVKTNEQKIAY